MKPFFSADMSSKDTGQTGFYNENSSDIDYSAAEDNLPDHVAPAVISFSFSSVYFIFAQIHTFHL